MDKTITAKNGEMRIFDTGVDVKNTSRNETLLYDEIIKVDFSRGTKKKDGTFDIYTKSKGNIRLKFEEKSNEEFQAVREDIFKVAGNKTTQLKSKKPFYFKWCAWAIVAIIVIIIAINAGGMSSASTKLTLDKYNKIENGMSYEQVIGIIGCEGTAEAELGEKGTSLHTISYRYMGDDQVKGSLGANASFMFQGGKLNMKAQMGLK